MKVKNIKPTKSHSHSKSKEKAKRKDDKNDLKKENIINKENENVRTYEVMKDDIKKTYLQMINKLNTYNIIIENKPLPTKKKYYTNYSKSPKRIDHHKMDLYNTKIRKINAEEKNSSGVVTSSHEIKNLKSKLINGKESEEKNRKEKRKEFDHQRSNLNKDNAKLRDIFKLMNQINSDQEWEKDDNLTEMNLNESEDYVYQIENKYIKNCKPKGSDDKDYGIEDFMYQKKSKIPINVNIIK